MNCAVLSYLWRNIYFVAIWNEYIVEILAKTIFLIMCIIQCRIVSLKINSIMSDLKIILRKWRLTSSHINRFSSKPSDLYIIALSLKVTGNQPIVLFWTVGIIPLSENYECIILNGITSICIFECHSDDEYSSFTHIL